MKGRTKKGEGNDSRRGLTKIVKILIVLLPVLLLLYIAYANFVQSHEFNSFYDIGSEEDNYLSPVDRISEKYSVGGVDYRNMTGHLVYFYVPIPRGSDKVSVDFSFINYVPEDSRLAVGGRIGQEWNYTYNWVFDKEHKMFNEKGEEVILSTEFNLSELYVQNGRLSLLFNVPHLYLPEGGEVIPIPLDWINITVYKDGII